MTLSPGLQRVLAPSTQIAWEELVPLRPECAYLVGGTAVAAHLGHRVSRDLDFFLSADFDLMTFRERLERTGHFLATLSTEDSLNGVLGDTKVQFLLATTQTNVEPLIEIDRLPVASIGDLLATKLKVIVDRGEMRDYFDLLCIEQQARRMAEEGLALFVRRYRPVVPDQALIMVVRALGSFADVVDDPGLPLPRNDIERYWRRRQPELLRHLDRSAAI